MAFKPGSWAVFGSVPQCLLVCWSVKLHLLGCPDIAIAGCEEPQQRCFRAGRGPWRFEKLSYLPFGNAGCLGR